MDWTPSIVDRQTWEQAAASLQRGEQSLLSLWGEPGLAHLALIESSRIRLLHLDCAAGAFPSVGRLHPPAIRLERAMQDLAGLRAEGAPDSRPWLRHTGPYPFLPAEGEGLHQIPVGPVHAGIIEPGHFRFTANGEHVVRLEQRLGWVHKGIESLMEGATLEQVTKLAARTSGDSTVAYAFAFAQAAEAAMQIVTPARASYLRALMAELERLANHFGDIGAICNDASFSLMQAQCAILRERTLRVAEAGFGHRLMMDVIVPGGLSRDIAPTGLAEAAALVAAVRGIFPDLIELYDNTASLQDRTVTTGIVKPELAAQ